jgi:hypothetical protein
MSKHKKRRLVEAKDVYGMDVGIVEHFHVPMLEVDHVLTHIGLERDLPGKHLFPSLPSTFSRSDSGANDEFLPGSSRNSRWEGARGFKNGRGVESRRSDEKHARRTTLDVGHAAAAFFQLLGGRSVSVSDSCSSVLF